MLKIQDKNIKNIVVILKTEKTLNRSIINFEDDIQIYIKQYKSNPVFRIHYDKYKSSNCNSFSEYCNKNKLYYDTICKETDYVELNINDKIINIKYDSSIEIIIDSKILYKVISCESNAKEIFDKLYYYVGKL